MSEITVKPFTQIGREEFDLVGQELSLLVQYRSELREQLHARRLGRLVSALTDMDAAKDFLAAKRNNADFYQPQAAILLDDDTHYVAGLALMEQVPLIRTSPAAKILGSLATRNMRIGNAMDMQSPRVTAFVDPKRPDWKDELAYAYSHVRDDPRPYHDGQTPAWAIETTGLTHKFNEFHDVLLKAGYRSIGEEGWYDFGAPDGADFQPGRLYIGQ